MKSQVTTKKGDAGQGKALDGQVYSKSHPVMECVGTLDELRAHTALLRLRIMETQDGQSHAEFLLWLLHQYFIIGSMCSDPSLKHVPEPIGPSQLAKLEQAQMDLEQQVRLPKEFTVSAQNLLAAQADIVTAISRRLERRLVVLTEARPDQKWSNLLAFTNRLSDYLFMLARRLDGLV